MSQRKSELANIAGVAQLLAVVLVVAALYFGRDVFIPLALGLLLSFLLSPIVNRLQRWGVNNIVVVGATSVTTSYSQTQAKLHSMLGIHPRPNTENQSVLVEPDART